ncbi:MAG: mannose-6-phosphate isomerase [Corynebacteriales bacterium]|nr:mannose-6-phosphate isomerase [Mycobacteriales bacterium]
MTGTAPEPASSVIDESRLEDPALWGAEPGNTGWARSADAMLRQLAASGAHLRESATLAAEAGLHELSADGRPRAVVIAGVGTAARTGEILSAVTGPRCPVPVLSHRSAGVPGWVGAADVVIAVSGSGKSPEALAAAEAAVHRGARLVAVSAPDSPLHGMAERARGAIFVPVPLRRPARTNLWGLVAPVLLAGRALGLVNLTEADIAETAARLDADAERCRADGDALTNEGKALALELAGSIPLVWGTTRLAGVAAGRFADQLAANARYPAMTGALIEASRGRVGVLDGLFGALAPGVDFFADRVEDKQGTQLRLVLLRESGASAENIRRADAVAELASERNVGVSTVTAEGVSELERVASLIMIPDFASVYLAALHGIDPIAVPAVGDLKNRIMQ